MIARILIFWVLAGCLGEAPAQAIPPSWTKCAEFGTTCSFSGRREVRYGPVDAAQTYIARIAEYGIPCIDEAWGANLGSAVGKACWLSDVTTTAALSPPVPQPIIPVTPPAPAWTAQPTVPAPPATWTQCADLGQNCTVAGRREVRFGPITPLAYWARVVEGSISCSPSAWGMNVSAALHQSCWVADVLTTAAVTAPVSPPPIPPAALVFTATAPAVVVELPPCWPSKAFGVPIPGAGSALQAGSLANVGQWYGWRCPGGVSYAKTVSVSYQGPMFTDIAQEAATSYPTWLEAANAMWLKYDASCPAGIASCQSGMQELAAAAFAALQPPPPPPPPPPSSWKVAPNPLSTTVPPTRPAYGFGDGRRKALVATRAIVGQPCNGDVAKVVEGTITYMAFGPGFSATEVAVCRQ